MAPFSTLKDLYVLTLRRLHRAERRALEVLPELIAAAAHRSLTTLLMKDHEAANRHADRLARVFNRMGLDPGSESATEPLSACLDACREMAGLDAAPDVRDSAIITAWRQYLHSIEASYEGASIWAKLLGDLQAYGELDETVHEKKLSAKAFIPVAGSINADAVAARS